MVQGILTIKKSMKKFIISSTGEEVNVGDVIEIRVTDDTVPMLLEAGIIQESGTHLDIDYYIGHLAERIKWNKGNVIKYLSNLSTIQPDTVYRILLREIAITFDEKYDNNIRKEDTLYYISTLNHKICSIKVDENVKKHLKLFAAFRTVDDAQAALHIMKPFTDVLCDE